MNLFERKAIEWLKSLDDPRNPTEEGYYAQLILAMLEGLGDKSVADLIELADELEGRVEYLEDVIESAGLQYTVM